MESKDFDFARRSAELWKIEDDREWLNKACKNKYGGIAANRTHHDRASFFHNWLRDGSYNWDKVFSLAKENFSYSKVIPH